MIFYIKDDGAVRIWRNCLSENSDSKELVTVVQDNTLQIKSIKSEINQTIEMIEQEEMKTDTGKT